MPRWCLPSLPHQPYAVGPVKMIHFTLLKSPQGILVLLSFQCFMPPNCISQKTGFLNVCTQRDFITLYIPVLWRVSVRLEVFWLMWMSGWPVFLRLSSFLHKHQQCSRLMPQAQLAVSSCTLQCIDCNIRIYHNIMLDCEPCCNFLLGNRDAHTHTRMDTHTYGHGDTHTPH